MKFEDKTALVTGGGRRIGKSIALALARSGSDIVVHYRSSAEEADSVCREIRGLGRRCWLSAHDLSDTENTETWFRELSAQTGGLDILVNSASEFTEGGYETMTGEDLNRSMSIHVLSPLIMIRMLFRAGREADVVNILDTRVADRDPIHAAYHLGKRSLFTLTRDLAVEMAPQITINAVAPGVILPPAGKDEAWIDQLKSTNPMGRRGTTDDISEAVIYLLGAGFVTGQVIFVDGGRHLKGNVYGL